MNPCPAWEPQKTPQAAPVAPTTIGIYPAALWFHVNFLGKVPPEAPAVATVTALPRQSRKNSAPVISTPELAVAAAMMVQLEVNGASDLRLRGVIVVPAPTVEPVPVFAMTSIRALVPTTSRTAVTSRMPMVVPEGTAMCRSYSSSSMIPAPKVTGVVTVPALAQKARPSAHLASTQSAVQRAPSLVPCSFW